MPSARFSAAGLPVPTDRAWLSRAVATLQERAKTLVELAEILRFYVSDEITIDAKAAAKHLTAQIAPALADLTGRLERLAAWDDRSIEAAFQETMAAYELPLGKLAQPVRVAVTGGTASPGIFEVLDLLGRERTLARLPLGASLSTPPHLTLIYRPRGLLRSGLIGKPPDSGSGDWRFESSLLSSLFGPIV